MSNTISGSQIAAEIRKKVKTQIAKDTDKNRPPALSVIIAGNDEASIYYSEMIEKAGKKDGIKVSVHHIKTPTPAKLLNLIDELNNNPVLDAILIQLPLPQNIDKNVVFNTLSPKKDVDGQTPLNIGRLAAKQNGTHPATAKAIIKILKGNNIKISEKRATVIGRSTAVGLPAALLLTHENATVTICHSQSIPLKKFTKEADILVVSAGKPELITQDYVKKGAIVIDVGTNDVDGKLVGDVDYDNVLKIALVSPVKGGVGAITLACLFENTYELYRKNLHRN